MAERAGDRGAKKRIGDEDQGEDREEPPDDTPRRIQQQDDEEPSHPQIQIRGFVVDRRHDVISNEHVTGDEQRQCRQKQVQDRDRGMF